MVCFTNVTVTLLCYFILLLKLSLGFILCMAGWSRGG